MMQSLLALATRRNIKPTSLMERIGDYFIAPLSYGFAQLKFDVIIKDNRKFAYDVPYDLHRADTTLKINGYYALRFLGMLLSPVAILGFAIKLVALLCSKRMRNIYLNWQTPAKIEFPYLLFNNQDEKQRAKMYNNINIMEAAIIESRASLLLEDIASQPKKWLIHYVQDGFTPGYGGYGETSMNLTPDIEECVCCNSGHFNRFNNQRRQTMEKRVAAALTARASMAPLSYLSCGAAGLLQELMMATILLSKGCDATMHLVDPLFWNISDDRTAFYSNDGKNKTKLLVDLLHAAAEEKGCNINLLFYSSIDQVPKDCRLDVITAIDFDDMFDDRKKGVDTLVEAQSRLKSGGRLYVSYNQHDLIYNQSGCIFSNQSSVLTLKKQETPEAKHYTPLKKPSLQTRMVRTGSWTPTAFKAAQPKVASQGALDDTADVLTVVNAKYRLQ